MEQGQAARREQGHVVGMRSGWSWHGRPRAVLRRPLSQHEELGFYPKWEGKLLGFTVGGRHDLIYVLKPLLRFC